MDPEMIPMFVNIGLLAVLLINMIRCGIKGFLLSLWECFGTLLAFFVSWNFASVFASIFHVVPLAYTPLGDTALGPLFNQTLNQYAWVLILFFLIKLALFLLKPLIKLISEIPLFKQINELIGAVFGIVITWVWALLAVFILSIPVFETGERIINATLLKPIKVISVAVMDEVGGAIAENETLSRLIAGEALSEKDQRILEEWLKEADLDEESLREYFNW